MAVDGSCLLAGALLWLIIQQVPMISKEEQDGIRPRFIISCYIIAQLGIVASALVTAKLVT